MYSFQFYYLLSTLNLVKALKMIQHEMLSAHTKKMMTELSIVIFHKIYQIAYVQN